MVMPDDPTPSEETQVPRKSQEEGNSTRSHLAV